MRRSRVIHSLSLIHILLLSYSNETLWEIHPEWRIYSERPIWILEVILYQNLCLCLFKKNPLIFCPWPHCPFLLRPQKVNCLLKMAINLTLPVLPTYFFKLFSLFLEFDWNNRHVCIRLQVVHYEKRLRVYGWLFWYELINTNAFIF